MSDPREPSDPIPPASPFARSLFEAARADLPSRERLDRIAAGLPLGGAPAPASGRRVRASRSRLWWPIAACAAVGLGAAVLFGARAASRSTQATAVSASPADWPPATSAPVATVPSAAPAPSTDALPTAEPRAPRPAPAVRTSPVHAPSPAHVPASTEAPDAGAAPAPAIAEVPDAGAPAPPGDEGDLLDRAAIVLERNPAEALRLAEQHDKGFPDGTLAAEREVIAVAALLQLGRADEARARGARFLQRYPTSPRRALVESMIGR
jgi:hypothetical protein